MSTNDVQADLTRFLAWLQQRHPTATHQQIALAGDAWRESRRLAMAGEPPPRADTGSPVSIAQDLSRESDFALVLLRHDPPGRMPGVCITAQLWANDVNPAPFALATAYLSDYSDAEPPLIPMVTVDFVLVPDQCRERGYGLELLRRLHAVFPRLKLTTAVSTAGEELIRAARRVGIDG